MSASSRPLQPQRMLMLQAQKTNKQTSGSQNAATGARSGPVRFGLTLTVGPTGAQRSPARSEGRRSDRVGRARSENNAESSNPSSPSSPSPPLPLPPLLSLPSPSWLSTARTAEPGPLGSLSRALRRGGAAGGSVSLFV